MSIAEAIEYQERHLAWRTGKDDRTMEAAGLTPAGITESQAIVIKAAKAAQKLFADINTVNSVPKK